MGSTDTLRDLLTGNKAWLLDRVLSYAKEHGYTRYAATQLKAWEISIIGITDSIVGAINSAGTIPELGVDDFAHETPIAAFGRQEVRRHRARGVTLPMFLGLVKYYRQSYLDLIRDTGLEPRTERDCLVLVERFFDLFEIGCGVEWNSLNHDERVEELQTLNRLMVNEKNKYYTIFESLYDPVILVDGDLCIEGMNEAAAEHFYGAGQRDTFSFCRPPVTDIFPWLAKEVTHFASTDDQEVVFEKVVDTPLGERVFEVKMKHMLDATEKYQGTVVILNDLTERRQKEEALVLNEAIEQWVSTLVGLGHRVSTMDDVESVLPLVVESARDLLDAEFAALGMWDHDLGHFEVRCVAHRRTTGVDGRTDRDGPLRYSHGPTCEARGCSCLKTIAARLSADLRSGPPAAGETACLTVPLAMDGEIVGALIVGRDAPFPGSAVVVLESLANQAIIAVEHAVMAQKIRSVAVLDERTRIAREMHDGLAQILGFLNLEMQSLEVLIRQNRVEETISELRNARARILEAHAEVRENILSLRTALSTEGGPITALKTYLAEFSAQTAVNVSVESEVDDSLHLSSMAQVQLVRIVQGALVNVRRHAHARNLWVSFARDNGSLAVVVEDDGVGFDVSAVRANIGLQSMRERTESVGGYIEIDSAPGRGTRVRLRVPLDVDRGELAAAGWPSGRFSAQP
ncbi:MAG: GAF domain-containing protein [Actinobacteria bacterium]|nr:GAF domain-containing protein [Actinomycetota bacterium]